MVTLATFACWGETASVTGAVAGVSAELWKYRKAATANTVSNITSFMLLSMLRFY